MKIKEFVRNPHNYDVDDASEETALRCLDEHRTEQEHIEEADINYIADRFMRTGEAPQLLNLPTAGDFSGIFDFQTAMNTIAQAKTEFMSLPAKIRTRFGNDPAQLLAFVQERDNYDEAVKLGFIPPKPAGTTGEHRERTESTGQRTAQEIPETTTRSSGTTTSTPAPNRPEKP